MDDDRAEGLSDKNKRNNNRHRSAVYPILILYLYSGSSLFRYFLNSEKGNDERFSNTLSSIILSHYLLGLSYWMSAQLWKACILWMNYFGLSLVRVLLGLQFRWSAKQTQYPPIPAYLGHILFSLIDHRTSLQALYASVCYDQRMLNL